MGIPRYWVNTASLNLVVEDTDFLYTGLGPQMRMTRTYNSNNFDQGMFGRGWSFSFESLVKSRLCKDGLKSVLLQSVTSDNMVYKADDAICSQGGVISPVPVTATPVMPPGNRDLLTWHPGAAGQRDYWIYEDKKTFFRYRYEPISSYASPAPDMIVWRLISVTDPNGNAVIVAYNTDETIKSLTDAAGRVTTFIYDAQKRCTSMTLPDGKTVDYFYDAAGYLQKTVDLMGNEIVYAYDADGFMTSMTVGDKVTSITYDDKNGAITPKRVASITDAEGKTQTYLWSLFDNSAADAHGNRTYYPANDMGQTTGTEDPLSATTNRVYDQGLLTEYSDPLGYPTRMQNDARGNLMQKVLPGQRTRTYTYDAADNRTSRTDGEGNLWLYEYDAKHNLTKARRPSGRSTTYTYDAKGQPLTVTDAKGGVTTVAYDQFGNVTSVTNPLGDKQLFSYDAQGILKLSETDPLGHITSFTYDANHRITGITSADGSTGQLHYDCCSLTGITDPNGNKTTIENNKVLKPVRITDPLGNSTRNEYDATHTLTKSIDQLGYATTINRDALYRPLSTTDAFGNTVSMTYNANWDIESLTNARGKKYSFTKMDTLPLSVRDPLNATTYTWWDKNKRLQRWQNARTEGVDYRYTPDGDLASKTAVYPAYTIASYAYDEVRRLTGVTDPSGTTTYSFDAAGRVTGILYPDGTTVGLAYDAGGNMTAITYPGGFTASYLYDLKNRVSSVSWAGNQVQYTYDPSGNPLQMTRSNGTATVQAFDKRNLVTGITHRKDTTVFAQMQLVRNPAGNIVTETRTTPVAPILNAGTSTATFNDADQLIQMSGNAYGYDADGNLVTVSGALTFDAVYDQVNRPVSITVGGIQTDYVYDGLGNRVRATTGGVVIRYHYDRIGRLLFETDGANALRAVYFYTGRQLVGMWTAALGHLFYHYDQLGSTAALTDGGGNVAAAYAYEPFGKLSNSTGTVYNPFTYVGAHGVMHEGNGIYFMKNRYYDSGTGRFLQKDPIGFAGGTNLYAYVNNNPVTFKDPKGLRLPPGPGGVMVTDDGLVLPVLGEPTGDRIADGICDLVKAKGIDAFIKWAFGWPVKVFSQFFSGDQETNMQRVREEEEKYPEAFQQEEGDVVYEALPSDD
jgi:RHS repeat-associated protein